VLILTAVHLTRLALSLRLPSLPLTVPAWYFALTGAVWGATGMLAAYGLFRGRRWAPRTVRWGALLYTAWFWADQALFVRAEYASQSRPALIALNLLAVATTIWILQREVSRQFFEEKPP
jgi:hypothetical protein